MAMDEKPAQRHTACHMSAAGHVNNSVTKNLEFVHASIIGKIQDMVRNLQFVHIFRHDLC